MPVTYKSPLGTIAPKASLLHITLVAIAISIVIFLLGLAGGIVFIDQQETVQNNVTESPKSASADDTRPRYSGTIYPLSINSNEVTHTLKDTSGKTTAQLKSNDDRLAFLLGKQVTVRGNVFKIEDNIPWVMVEEVVFK